MGLLQILKYATRIWVSTSSSGTTDTLQMNMFMQHQHNLSEFCHRHSAGRRLYSVDSLLHATRKIGSVSRSWQLPAIRNLPRYSRRRSRRCLQTLRCCRDGLESPKILRSCQHTLLTQLEERSIQVPSLPGSVVRAPFHAYPAG